MLNLFAKQRDWDVEDRLTDTKRGRRVGWIGFGVGIHYYELSSNWFWELDYFLPYWWTRMSQSPAIAATTDGELVRPGGNSGRKEYLPSSSHQTTATPHGEPWASSGCENRILPTSPSIAEGNKGMTSVSPGSCIFPYRKVLNCLSWAIWFSFLNNNLLLSDSDNLRVLVLEEISM